MSRGSYGALIPVEPRVHYTGGIPCLTYSLLGIYAIVFKGVTFGIALHSLRCSRAYLTLLRAQFDVFHLYQNCTMPYSCTDSIQCSFNRIDTSNSIVVCIKGFCKLLKSQFCLSESNCFAILVTAQVKLRSGKSIHA